MYIMFAYDATKYPLIYKGTYWGNFTVEKFPMITNDILINRNKFVEKYNVKSNSTKPNYIKNEFKDDINISMFDHNECYKTHDKKYILISSPYTNEFLNKGWIITDKLYASGATTYIKIINMKK